MSGSAEANKQPTDFYSLHPSGDVRFAIIRGIISKVSEFEDVDDLKSLLFVAKSIEDYIRFGATWPQPEEPTKADLPALRAV